MGAREALRPMRDSVCRYDEEWLDAIRFGSLPKQILEPRRTKTGRTRCEAFPFSQKRQRCQTSGATLDRGNLQYSRGGFRLCRIALATGTLIHQDQDLRQGTHLLGFASQGGAEVVIVGNASTQHGLIWG